VDVTLAIRQRLDQLKLDQRDLAVAAQVTESYISQLLTGKKPPPAPDRTDIYEKMGKALKLPNGELAKLADLQRNEGLKRKLGDPPAPLFQQVRELILHKCSPNKQSQMRAIFEKQPFGELERLVTQKLLDVVKEVAKQELENETWLRLVARLGNRTYEQMRVIVLEFLDADVFDVSAKNCESFLDPLIESWDIDLVTFGMDIVLNHSVAPGQSKKFEYVESSLDPSSDPEPGLQEFLRNSSLSGDATEEEIAFLKKLRFRGKRPTTIYFYRELQSLRDPLHFRTPQIK
jgi:transcriptional regulator with XRE-family HTH domain